MHQPVQQNRFRVEGVLERLVDVIPAPEGDRDAPFTSINYRLMV